MNKTNKKTEAYPEDLALAIMERTIRRFWILTILLAVLLAGSWIGFFAYESQFQTVSVENAVEQDAQDGTNYFTGGDYYGQTGDSYPDSDPG